MVKKSIILHKKIEKELYKLPKIVQLKLKGLLEILESEGKLEIPFAKKLSKQEGLFEIRIKHKGQWRVIYAYTINRSIIILNVFLKKTKKTPLKELNKSHKRLKTYLKKK
jgi:phage-related protein